MLLNSLHKQWPKQRSTCTLFLSLAFSLLTDVDVARE